MSTNGEGEEVSILILGFLFNEISKYKQVASGGKYLNNVGGSVKDKKEFLQKYKFNIASENSIVNGYITEKLVDAFNAHTVPIYAGPNDVINEFNSASFINLNDFASFTDLLMYIERVDTDEAITMQDCAEIEKALNVEIVKTLFLCNRQKTKFYLFILCDVFLHKFYYIVDILLIINDINNQNKRQQ